MPAITISFVFSRPVSVEIILSTEHLFLTKEKNIPQKQMHRATVGELQTPSVKINKAGTTGHVVCDSLCVWMKFLVRAKFYRWKKDKRLLKTRDGNRNGLQNPFFQKIMFIYF